MKNVTLSLLLAQVLSWQFVVAQDKKVDTQSKDQSKKEPAPGPPAEPMPDIPFAAPDNRDRELGKYLEPRDKDVSVVMASPIGKSSWQQLNPGQSVRAGQTYLALPGCRGDFQLAGVMVTLLGTLPEIVPSPTLLESMVELHQHKALTLDFTVKAGRVIITSLADKARARIRFENPNFPAGSEFFDIVLHGKGTQALVDRGGRVRPGRAFFKDPKDPKREPPGAFTAVWALKGNTFARYGDESVWLTPPPGRAMLLWSSIRGLKQPEVTNEFPPTVSVNPPLPEETDPKKLKLRDEILKARDDLTQEIPSKPINFRLAVMCVSDSVGRRIMALRCNSAIGAVPELVEGMVSETDPAAWHEAILSVKHLMAMSRDNEYLVFEQMRKRFTAIEADTIMQLLHGFFAPETLVDHLNNPVPILRRFAHHNLCELLPKGRDIPYDATMQPEQRMKAQDAWLKLLQK